MARRTIFDWLDDHHARVRADAYWSDEARASRLEGHRQEAAMIHRAADCPDCLAPAGQPCVGLSDHAFHFARGERASRNWMMTRAVQ